MARWAGAYRKARANFLDSMKALHEGRSYRKRKFNSIVVVVLLVVTVGTGLLGASLDRMTLPLRLLTPSSEPRPNQKTVLVKLLDTPTITFYCRYVENTESPCDLSAAGTSINDARDLGYSVDTPDRAVLLSPDQQNLLVVEETSAYIISVDTLQVVLSTSSPPGDAFGTYDALPSFIPHARWVGNKEFELFTFRSDTPEPLANTPDAMTPKPLDIIHISI